MSVPGPGGTDKGGGGVLTVALDDDADVWRLIVLDGGTLEERARATLPHRVPFDFHGRYFPGVRASASA